MISHSSLAANVKQTICYGCSSVNMALKNQKATKNINMCFALIIIYELAANSSGLSNSCARWHWRPKHANVTVHSAIQRLTRCDCERDVITCILHIYIYSHGVHYEMLSYACRSNACSHEHCIWACFIKYICSRWTRLQKISYQTNKFTQNHKYICLTKYTKSYDRFVASRLSKAHCASIWSVCFANTCMQCCVLHNYSFECLASTNEFHIALERHTPMRFDLKVNT